MERREYEMSQADLDEIIRSIREAVSAPLIALHTGMPPSPQMAANEAWKRLGAKMGFDGMSVLPSDKGRRVFTAMPVELAKRQAPGNGWDVVREAQDILASYIVPDSGISDAEAVNRLLGLLDREDVVKASRAGGAP